MMSRPLSISDSDREQYTEHVKQVHMDVEEWTGAIINDIPHESLQRHVAETVFTPNQLLPKRNRRPKREVSVLIDGIERAVGEYDEYRQSLHKFGLLVSEYYDICDDVVDGDVADGAEEIVVLIWQVLTPLLVRIGSQLGQKAVDFWSARAMGLIEAPMAATMTDPSLKNYMTIIDRQADLFGSVTGLCGLVSECDNATTAACEALGRHYFRFEQLLLDGEQHGDEVWNLFELSDPEQALTAISDARSEYRNAVADLPSGHEPYLDWLVAVDIDAWAQEQGLIN